MEKIPRIAIDAIPIEIWFEGPGYVVAQKPAQMASAPEHSNDRGTMANALLQANRWLAEMESSLAPGLIHRFRPQDRGLMVWAKNEETLGQLSQALGDRQLQFRYRVLVPGLAMVPEHPLVQMFGIKTYADTTVIDIDSPMGDTDQLARQWLGPAAETAEFVCYQIELPDQRRVAMANRVSLPELELFTAPP